MSDFLRKRREVVLGILLMLLVVTIWKRVGGGAAGGGGVDGGGSGRGPRPDLAALKLYPIDWASLQAGRPSYDPNGRNIFQYGQIPPPPPPVLTAAEQAAIRKAQADAAAERERQMALLRAAEERQANDRKAEEQRVADLQANPPPPPPPPKPQPPAITYKFIGYFGPAKNKVAVLYDGADQIFVRQGEELPKGIKVLEIGYESIKFGFTDPQFRDESRTLPMSSSY
ncbi:MAG TPA: hypothetical protein VMQ62_08290 [Dongiaceae bacterium]|nr:hypothetical protein [Dongiaceae bacterium]